MDIKSYNPQEVATQILEKLKDAQKNMTNLNVMVFGITGVGKSTLINNVFSENLAEIGVGRPITMHIRKYSKEGFPLSIYDSPGLELKGNNSVDNLLKEAVDVVNDGIKSGDISKAIHCAWYCISAESSRIQESEMNFIRSFIEKTNNTVPVIIVLTKSYIKENAQSLKSAIEKENLPIAQIVPVLAMDTPIDEEYIKKSFGLDRLVEIMESVVDESVKNTLAAVQKASIQIKVNKAHAIVVASAAAAAATAAVPIPFSDAALLIPEEVSMLAGITVVFGLPVEKATLSALISSTIGTTGATVLGKAIVSELLKLIPVIGSFVGSAISATVAATLTAALGETYIIIMKLVMNGEMSVSDISSKKGKEKITTIFKERMSIKRKENGEPEESTEV